MSDRVPRPVGRPRNDGKPPLERRQVLMAAGSLMTEHGYAGTSLRMIAENLGTSAPAIAQRFGTKAELLNELVIAMAAISIRFHEALKALETAPDVRLYKMVQAEVQALASADHAPISVFYLPELRRPEFKPAQDARSKMMSFYEEVIEQGIDTALFHSVPVKVAAEQVFQLTETVIIARDPSAMGTPVELAGQTADFALRGLLRKPARLSRVRQSASSIELAMT